MGMHKFREPTWTRPLKTRIARDISAEFGARILALRLEAKVSRRVVHNRTGIAWQKIRQIEEGWFVPSLLDAVKLADFFGVDRVELIASVVTKANRGKAALKKTREKCLCDRLGEDGRAALRGIARKLAPHAWKVQRGVRKRR